MEYIPLNKLQAISSYSDIRSVRRWINSLGLVLLKIGKTYCVQKEDFERAFTGKYEIEKKEIKQTEEYKPVGKHEKAFFEELTQIIKEL